jgi:hypothetical protein
MFILIFFLLLSFTLKFAETTDGRANSGGVGGRESVSTTSLSLVATTTTPDTDSTTTEAELTAEGAEVASLCGDFELLGTLAGVGTITGTITSHDAHLLSALGHLVFVCFCCCWFCLKHFLKFLYKVSYLPRFFTNKQIYF